MQAVAYEGYFNDGHFYASGKAVHIPEQRRIFLAVFDEVSDAEPDKQAAWKDFKRMVKETAHENDLLSDDAFSRSEGGRKLINFADGANGL